MIREEGNRAFVEGAMNLATATALLEAGNQVVAREARVFDLSQVSEVDSSGIAVVFGWMRAAARAGRKLEVVNPPESFLSMAGMYGVRDLLPLA